MPFCYVNVILCNVIITFHKLWPLIQIQTLKLLLITETIGQEALKHWALGIELWALISKFPAVDINILNNPIPCQFISIVPFIGPWEYTCRKWPLQVSTVTVYPNIQNSQKCEFIYQSDPSDRFGNDVFIFEDGLLRMYPYFEKIVYYVREPISGQDNFPSADWFPYVVDRLREDGYIRSRPSSRRRSTT